MRALDAQLSCRLQDWGEIAFHADPQFNPQFNRYCVDAAMIDTMRAVAGRVKLPLLTNARSVTSRTFTEREHKAAAAHCNVGNGVMSLIVKVDWLDQCRGLDSL